MMQAAKERQIILDPACGSRMFYHDKNNPHVLFGDVRKAEFVAMDRGRARKIVIDPDVVLDFKNLPFVTGAFKIVTFDPPHLLRGGGKFLASQEVRKVANKLGRRFAARICRVYAGTRFWRHIELQVVGS